MTKTLPIIGEPLEGGFYAGNFNRNNQLYALIVAPKESGGHKNAEWNSSYSAVKEAMNYDDGLANTQAMADAGSGLAKWALGLNIDDFDDWYLPSQDELEILYRNLKPTKEKNWCYMRSGINLSAAEPMRPYTPDTPSQTSIEIFMADSAQAFDDCWYWSSTQYAGYSDYAWCQDFNNGNQLYHAKYHELRARAVRRLAI